MIIVYMDFSGTCNSRNFFQLFKFLRWKKQKLKSKLKISLTTPAIFAPTQAHDWIPLQLQMFWDKRTSVESECQKNTVVCSCEIGQEISKKLRDHCKSFLTLQLMFPCLLIVHLGPYPAIMFISLFAAY